MPEEAATVTSPDGRRMLFLRVPQAVRLLQEVLGAQPTEVTYRWAYHPGHKIYVMFVYWNSGHQVGLAIPEGAGDPVLSFLEAGTCDAFITEAEVEKNLDEHATKEIIEQIIYGVTVPVPQVKFQRQTV